MFIFSLLMITFPESLIRCRAEILREREREKLHKKRQLDEILEQQQRRQREGDDEEGNVLSSSVVIRADMTLGGHGEPLKEHVNIKRRLHTIDENNEHSEAVVEQSMDYLESVSARVSPSYAAAADSISNTISTSNSSSAVSYIVGAGVNSDTNSYDIITQPSKKAKKRAVGEKRSAKRELFDRLNQLKLKFCGKMLNRLFIRGYLSLFNCYN
jgi:Mg2+ and Co2+ transporter CorA